MARSVKQALIGGRESVLGSERNAIVAALRGARQGIALSAAASGDEIRIELDV